MKVWDGVAWQVTSMPIATGKSQAWVSPDPPPGTPVVGDQWYDTDDYTAFTLPVPVQNGGTGGITTQAARTNLSVPRLDNTAVVVGPPAGGTYVRGDQWLDSANVLWTCTVAGSPGTWVFLGRNIRFAKLQAPGTNVFTNQTTYAPLPNSINRNSMQVAFTKRMSSTRILFTVMAHTYMTAGAAQMIYAGVTNGTFTYDVAQSYPYTALPVGVKLVGQAEVYGINAGPYVFEPMFRSATTATFQFDLNWELSYSVEELV